MFSIVAVASLLLSCCSSLTPLPGNPNNGQPLSGTWIGVWDFTTTDSTIACMDNKTFILTQIGDGFTGNGSFVAQQPVQSGCESDGTFTITTGKVNDHNVNGLEFWR